MQKDLDRTEQKMKDTPSLERRVTSIRKKLAPLYSVYAEGLELSHEYMNAIEARGKAAAIFQTLGEHEKADEERVQQISLYEKLTDPLLKAEDLKGTKKLMGKQACVMEERSKALANRLEVFKAEGKPAKAIEVCGKIVENFEQLGVIYNRMKETRLANKAVFRASEYLGEKATLLSLSGDLEKASEARMAQISKLHTIYSWPALPRIYERQYANCRKQYLGRRELANALAMQGEFAPAEKEYLSLIELLTKMVSIRLIRSELSKKLQNTEAAKEELELRASPLTDLSQAYDNLAKILARLGKDNSVETNDPVKANDPVEAFILATKYRGDVEEILKKAAGLKPTEASVSTTNPVSDKEILKILEKLADLEQGK
ncbi:MAG: hypothetical protein NT157_02510 [Candidatus Micrarchaeota archaeon]|nr:hypothetical protein [Candidatus Micrarchaeota archaeon]